MKSIETYKGIEILYNEKGTARPYSTIQNNVPVIGTLETAHKTIDDAKLYIDKIQG